VICRCCQVLGQPGQRRAVHGHPPGDIGGGLDTALSAQRRNMSVLTPKDRLPA